MNYLEYIPIEYDEECVLCGKPMVSETFHKQGGYCSMTCKYTDIEL